MVQSDAVFALDHVLDLHFLLDALELVLGNVGDLHDFAREDLRVFLFGLRGKFSPTNLSVLALS